MWIYADSVHSILNEVGVCEVCGEALAILSGNLAGHAELHKCVPDSLKTAITGDVSWVYGCDLETKVQLIYLSSPKQKKKKKPYAQQ